MVMSAPSIKKKKGREGERESSRQCETVDSKTIIRRVQLRAPLIDTLEMRVAVQGGLLPLLRFEIDRQKG